MENIRWQCSSIRLWDVGCLVVDWRIHYDSWVPRMLYHVYADRSGFKVKLGMRLSAEPPISGVSVARDTEKSVRVLSCFSGLEGRKEGENAVLSGYFHLVYINYILFTIILTLAQSLGNIAHSFFGGRLSNAMRAKNGGICCHREMNC
jgi:hypothetical protein